MVSVPAYFHRYRHAVSGRWGWGGGAKRSGMDSTAADRHHLLHNVRHQLPARLNDIITAVHQTFVALWIRQHQTVYMYVRAHM